LSRNPRPRSDGAPPLDAGCRRSTVVTCVAGPLPLHKPLTLMEASDLARSVVPLRSGPRSLATAAGASYCRTTGIIREPRPTASPAPRAYSPLTLRLSPCSVPSEWASLLHVQRRHVFVHGHGQRCVVVCSSTRLLLHVAAIVYRACIDRNARVRRLLLQLYTDVEPVRLVVLERHVPRSKYFEEN